MIAINIINNKYGALILPLWIYLRELTIPIYTENRLQKLNETQLGIFQLGFSNPGSVG